MGTNLAWWRCHLASQHIRKLLRRFGEAPKRRKTFISLKTTGETAFIRHDLHDRRARRFCAVAQAPWRQSLAVPCAERGHPWPRSLAAHPSPLPRNLEANDVVRVHLPMRCAAAALCPWPQSLAVRDETNGRPLKQFASAIGHSSPRIRASRVVAASISVPPGCGGGGCVGSRIPLAYI